MTKYERMEVAKLTWFVNANSGAAHDSDEVGILARSFSALVRSARTTQSRNEVITAASAWPCVVQHPEFIV